MDPFDLSIKHFPFGEKNIDLDFPGLWNDDSLFPDILVFEENLKNLYF